MWATGHEERCPVMLFEEYVAQRPSAMCLSDSPFWLAITYNPSNGKFLKNQKIGVKKINGLMKAMFENISNGNGQKYTNHSNRKTLVTTLLGNNIERSDNGQLSGHRNVQSLDSYAATPQETQQRMSSIISKQMCSGFVQSETPHRFQQPASTSSSGEATTVRTNSAVVVNATHFAKVVECQWNCKTFFRCKFWKFHHWHQFHHWLIPKVHSIQHLNC